MKTIKAILKFMVFVVVLALWLLMVGAFGVVWGTYIWFQWVLSPLAIIWLAWVLSGYIWRRLDDSGESQ